MNFPSAALLKFLCLTVVVWPATGRGETAGQTAEGDVAAGAVLSEATAADATGTEIETEFETESEIAATAADAETGEVTAESLVAGALDLIRGRTSYTELSMIIHRPEWERISSLVSWTRGREDALIRFTAPARDAGNATLKQGDKMWTFTPKLNRTIRLPYSLMSQSWAGSDFSYNDLSRTDDLLRHYQLTIVDQTEEDGHQIYTVEAVPHDDAPVVWGMEEWVMRDDHVLISQTFYDQDKEALKRMETLEIGELGGRVMPLRMRMAKLDEPDNYTEVIYDVADFDIEIEDRTFTVFSLQSGGR